MGHMNVTENLRPLAERVGCSDHPEGYNFDCFDCWIRNGGGND